jgi:hypothetical protein
MNCFHCGGEITRDTDFVQCLLRDRNDNDSRVVFHPACFDEFREQKANPGSLNPEYRTMMYEIVRPTH